jgi:predicted MFS family arabinose efflux permease
MLATDTTHRLRLPGGRSFHLLLTSLAISSCGDWLYNVALLAVVFERTGSATWVALTTAARVVPVVVLGPIGGVMAGRYDRRRLILASDLLRALLMVALAATAAAGLPILLAPMIAAAATAAGVLQPPCVAACTARFVDDSELQSAQALRSAIGQAAIVVGPALGAVVLLVSTPAVAILLNALTFLGSAAAIASIRPGEAFRPAARQPDAPAPGMLAEILDGARALRGAPTAVRLVAADVLCSGVYGLLTVTLVMVSGRVGAGESGYGLLLGAFGAGGVIGAIVTARIEAAGRWRRTLGVALTLVGLPLAALGVASTLPLALALALLAGGGMIVGEVLSGTALPRLLDDAVLARAYGLVFPISIGGIVAGALIAGPLLSAFGLTGALAAAGLFVLLAAALLLQRPLSVQSASRLATSAS